MDVVADLLQSARARGSVLRQVIQAPPWSVRYVSPPPLTLHAMLGGVGWIIPDRAAPVSLATGDIALTCGPASYTVADDPSTPPSMVIRGIQDCSTADGTSLDEPAPVAPRTYGEPRNGAAMMVTGSYPAVSNVAERLLCGLPPVLYLPAAESPRTLLALVADEIAVDQPGQQIVLDRLIDLLLVRTLRAWFARADTGAPGWYRAIGDEIVGPALRALHARPAHPWTVAELAATAGVSRAALARRFTALVGQPPLTYLTSWRMSLAADLLHEPRSTITEVARRVGYTDAFAFSTAFKRLRGITPSAYRVTLSGNQSAPRTRRISQG